jgi:hypothetical protein
VAGGGGRFLIISGALAADTHSDRRMLGAVLRFAKHNALRVWRQAHTFHVSCFQCMRIHAVSTAGPGRHVQTITDK